MKRVPIPDVIVVDFETEAIESRPSYPPVPVGVALKHPADARPYYLAWGHPSGNNITKRDAQRRLHSIWRDPLPKLLHNAKFDLDVAETHLELPPLRWEAWHDTLFLLFLTDPHAVSLSLKPSAERILHVKAKERDALRDWILANVPEAKAKPKAWGAYISRAPAGLVGRYAAQGDVAMTLGLFKRLWPQVQRDGMQEAYDRERRLLRPLLTNERLGLRVDLDRLERDIPAYERAGQAADAWLRRQLKAPDLNLDSNEELAQALLRAKVASEDDFLWTEPSRRFPDGQMSVSKESLAGAVKDPRVLQVLGYRSRLVTAVGTFMRPWRGIASANRGRIHTVWHQVRQGHGNDNDNSGARTGRIISSDPNLLNLSKDFEGRDDGYAHPRFLRTLPPLPLVRVYILPELDEVFLHRDYDQQELRILAHFEDGALLRQYQLTPDMDVHNWVRDEIRRVVGLIIHDRSRVKTINFGDIYGLGIPGLVRKLKCTVAEAKELKSAKRRAMPDVEDLKKSIKMSAQQGEPIRTWGGRLYYVEPPQIVDDYARTFEYKLLNYLVQGSAADATKEAVIRYHELPNREGRFLVTVYDEINGSGPRGAVARELLRFREAMESVKFDLPMLSSAKTGPNWGELKKFEEPR